MANHICVGRYGGYTFSGRDAVLTANYPHVCDYGAFTYTGQAVGPLHHFSIAPPSPLSYLLTGNPLTNILHHHVLVATYGAFTYTGQASSLPRLPRLPGEKATFALTGKPAGLLRQKTLVATTGSYTLTGLAAFLARLVPGAAELNIYTIAGQIALLLSTRNLTASTGSYSMVPTTTTLTFHRFPVLAQVAVTATKTCNITIAYNPPPLPY